MVEKEDDGVTVRMAVELADGWGQSAAACLQHAFSMEPARLGLWARLNAMELGEPPEGGPIGTWHTGADNYHHHTTITTVS